MPEIRALVGGYLPSFITSSSDEVTDIPVFVFHTVQPHRFEPQLVHLVRNNYRCLDCDEVASRVKLGKLDQREVALTFDDATWCFWAYAFPLLRKYQLRATLFVIPGITSDDRRSYPNLDDLWAGRASSSELIARSAVQPLCTWRELQIMNESGLIDIQSHSLTHALVPVKPRVADFLHPRFKTFFCNIAIPLSTGEDPLRPKRPLRLGAPVFISASRLAGRPRFFEDPGLVAALERHIRANGQREFFQRSGWRAELRRILRRWPLEKRGRFESRGDGPDRSLCQRMINQLGLEHCVRLAGQREDVPDILAASDVLAIPSLTEGLPYVAIEAAAAGRPVVAFDCGGVPDVVLQGQTGILVPAGDESALATAIVRVLADPALAKRLGEAGRRHAGRFTVGRHVARLEEIYNAVLEDGASDRAPGLRWSQPSRAASDDSPQMDCQ